METKKELYKDLKTCIELSEFITALGNPKRVEIVCLLKDGPKNVSIKQ